VTSDSEGSSSVKPGVPLGSESEEDSAGPGRRIDSDGMRGIRQSDSDRPEALPATELEVAKLL
jgi:hypothetical protein